MLLRNKIQPKFSFARLLHNAVFLLSSISVGFQFFSSIYHFPAFLLYSALMLCAALVFHFDPAVVRRNASSRIQTAAVLISCFLSSSFYTVALTSNRIQGVLQVVRRFLPLSLEHLTFAATLFLGFLSIYSLLFILCTAIEGFDLRREFQHLSARLRAYSGLGRSFLFLFLIYLLSISSLLRANVDFHDDMQRIVDGVPGFELFSRHLMGFLSKVVNTGTYLADISPLTQILAVLILSAASLILILTFSDKEKITLWNLAAVLPLGLSPYFLECLSFKFDSPYMALTVLLGVLPFLFRQSKPSLYFTVIALCTLSASSIYQASLGIFPSLVVLLAFLLWLRNPDWKKTFSFILISAAGYLAGMILYRIFIMRPVSDYVSSEMFSLKNLPGGVLANLKQYFSLVLFDFDIKWLCAAAFLLVSFLYLSLRKTKARKLLTFIFGAAAIVLSLSLSFGLYIALTTPSFSCRAMYGFGVCIAAIAVSCTNFERSHCARLGALYLSWCLVVFSFLYGNALQEQVRYRDFRIESVIQEVNGLGILNHDGNTNIQITGTIGISPIVKNMPQYQGVLQRLVSMTFQQDGGTWNDYPFYHYYGLEHIVRADHLTEMDLPMLHDGYYETIYGDSENLLISLK